MTHTKAELIAAGYPTTLDDFCELQERMTAAEIVNNCQALRIAELDCAVLNLAKRLQEHIAATVDPEQAAREQDVTKCMASGRHMETA